MMDFFGNTWLLWVILTIGGALYAKALNSQYWNYVLNRYVMVIVTLFLVSGLVFALMETIPGDCAEKMIAYKSSQGQTITQEDIDAERVRMGLDQPMVVRWATWATNLTLRGDLGFSCSKRQAVANALGDRFWLSFGFCIAGLILSYVLAVPFGVFSSYMLSKPWVDKNPQHSPSQRGMLTISYSIQKILDATLRIISYLGLAIPNFLLALTIILLFVFAGKAMPTGIFSDEWARVPWFSDGFQFGKLWDFLGHIWLPIFVIGWSATALQLQTVRALVVDESNKLYVEAAKARGVSGMSLWMKYPVRHSISPLFNSIGFDWQRIYNDLPIVAVVIGLTDSASLLIEALAMTNDQQLAAAILFLVALVVIAFNFVTDVILAAVDPRVRRSVMVS